MWLAFGVPIGIVAGVAGYIARAVGDRGWTTLSMLEGAFAIGAVMASWCWCSWGCSVRTGCYARAMPSLPSSNDSRRSNRATMVLADISGYTAFLSDVATAHPLDLEAGDPPPAYPLMSTFLDSIVTSLTPPFVLSKLEGDAVFAYADDDALEMRGDAVTACLRGCYANFREHLRKTEDGLTCTCDACSSGARLDLKFVLHHGSYVPQSIAGRTELLGPDVTAAHRMLKNDVVARTGWPAYALISAAAVEHLDVPRDEGVPFELEYEHMGRMEALVLPLR